MDALNFLNEAIGVENLSEAYFGKNKNLLKIEKLFDEILERNREASEKINNVTTKSIKNKSIKNVIRKSTDSIMTFKSVEDIDFAIKNFRKIEKIIKDEFGFKFVNLEFANLITDGNPKGRGRRGGFAFTMGKYCMVEVLGSQSYEVISTENGVKYVKDIFGMCTFLDDSVFDGTFTAGEITSILLHEIGHNFFRNNNMASGLLGATALSIALLTCSKVNTNGITDADKKAIVAGTIGSAVIGYVLEALKKSGLTTLLSKAFICAGPFLKLQQLSIRIQKMIDVFGKGLDKFSILDDFTNIFNTHFNNIFLPSNAINAIDGASNEKFADVFATAYGYGPESITASGKIDGAIDWNIPGFNTAADLLRFPGKMFAYLVDVHPNSYQRMEDQIKYAKAQFNTVKDPKVKKALLQNIEEMEVEIKKASKKMMADDLKQGRFFSLLFNILTISILKGVSPHSLIPTNRKLTHALDFRKDADWAQFKSTEKNILKKI